MRRCSCIDDAASGRPPSRIALAVPATALHLRGALNGDTPDVRTLAILALPVISQHLGELTVVRATTAGK